MVYPARGLAPGSTQTWVVEWVVGAGTAEKFVVLTTEAILPYENIAAMMSPVMAACAMQVNGQFADDAREIFEEKKARHWGDEGIRHFMLECATLCGRAPASTVRMYSQS